MSTVYNDVEPFACDWLERLIERGHLSSGRVDRRSIADIQGADLEGATRFHAFAGLGGWDYALRLAGVPDDVACWTGSCPCQPFSVAGRRRSHADARHLWPEWFRLIRERRPSLVFGEQVADGAALEWIDAVQADLESIGYTFGAAVLPAACVGAPHRRHRTYFGAHADSAGRAGLATSWIHAQRQPGHDADGRGNAVGGPDTNGGRGRPHPGAAPSDESRDGGRRAENDHEPAGDGAARGRPDTADVGRERGWVARGRRAGPTHDGGVVGGPDADGGGQRPGNPQDPAGPRVVGPHASGVALECHESECAGLEGLAGDGDAWRGPGWLSAGARRSATATGATRGYWGGCEWWLGRDGRWRPIGPGLFPLAYGVPARVGRLRAYGNAIVPQVAAAFIRAFVGAIAEGLAA